jgi:hypothetical protein
VLDEDEEEEEDFNMKEFYRSVCSQIWLTGLTRWERVSYSKDRQTRGKDTVLDEDEEEEEDFNMKEFYRSICSQIWLTGLTLGEGVCFHLRDLPRNLLHLSRQSSRVPHSPRSQS